MNEKQRDFSDFVFQKKYKQSNVFQLRIRINSQTGSGFLES